MRLLKRVLQVIVVIVLLLIVVGGSGGYWFVTKSFPQINGSLRVAGLKSKVEIVRDPMGIPHIYADNADDLFFVNGFVHAQDRLWQMEFNRRVGRGMLSEIFGNATIKQDRFLRTIGLERAARADLAIASEDSKHILQMYANGVNAFVEANRDNLPIEFTILGFKPAPWEPIDTAVWAKVMAYDLSGRRYETDLLRYQMLMDKNIGAAKIKELMPPYPETGPFIAQPEVNGIGKLPAPNYPESDIVIARSALPARGASLCDEATLAVLTVSTERLGDCFAKIARNDIGRPDLREIAQLNDSLLLGDWNVGSNNWVVDGTKTTTGKPLLANDPHLAIQMPSIWYVVGLHCVPQNASCPYNVAGVGFPGSPGVVIGHNDRVAWGMTNVGADVVDLYVEETNPQNPNQYKFQGKWEDMQSVEEIIKIKGSASESLKVQTTRHGPVMTPVLAGIKEPLALQWAAIRERSQVLESILMLDRAKNWEDFRAALKLFDAPSQNFVYADVDGNIGYQMPGNIPIRAKGDGTLPVSGNGEFEWTGYIPFQELPSLYNPPAHFIATANNAVVPSTYKYWLGYDWSAPYRAQRIIDLLRSKDKLSSDDFKMIQGDVYSIPEEQLQKYVLALKPEGFLQQRAMEHVKSFDGSMTTENIGGTILEVTYQRLVRNTFGNKIDVNVLDSYLNSSDNHRRAMLMLLEQPNSEWWGAQGRDAILKKSFAEGVDWLGSQFGDAPGEWKWSRLHTASFEHPIGSVKPLDRLFNAGPIAVPGGVFTVFATSFRGSAPYVATSISSERQIIDLANLSNSRIIHPTGQSGQPLNKHYTDMVPLWRDVQYVPFYFDRAALDKVREGILILMP